MTGIYSSGTGNTKHCVEMLVSLLDASTQCFPIECTGIENVIVKHDSLVLRYPTQFSNVPFVVCDLTDRHRSLWNGKAIFILNTIGLFSGDGTGCTARLLKKCGATVLGGLQIKTPDPVCDSRLLKKNTEENRRIARKTDKRMAFATEQIRRESYPRESLPMIVHFKGLFGQRLWFYRKMAGYTDQLKINSACIGCGVCSEICPMGNIRIQSKRVVSGNRRITCYCCIGLCPKKAIVLLGKRVIE